VEQIGLYLAGAGSLDGSDPFLTAMTYEVLQDRGWTPMPVARDVEQGEVINHRFAYEESPERNSLDESARLVRGNIRDFRDVETEDLSGGVLVGGGGVLSTWTDYHERGRECRITERLKFHLHEFQEQGKPILALDNSAVAVAVAFRERELDLTLNPGANSELRSDLASFGVSVDEDTPSVDEAHDLVCLPDLVDEVRLPEARNQLTGAIDSFQSLCMD